MGRVHFQFSGAGCVYKTYMKLQGTESKAASGIPHENLDPHFTDIEEGLQVQHIVNIEFLNRNEPCKNSPRCLGEYPESEKCSTSAFANGRKMFISPNQFQCV